MAEKKTTHRPLRVAVRVRDELALLLIKELRDPRLVGAIISRVELSPDLRNARVWVRHVESQSESKRAETLSALARASSFLRREVAARVGLRFAPELRFAYDTGVDAVENVERILKEVAEDEKNRSTP